MIIAIPVSVSRSIEYFSSECLSYDLTVFKAVVTSFHGIINVLALVCNENIRKRYLINPKIDLSLKF